MKNALIIGGTGMLAGLSLTLLDSYRIFVVARHHETLEALRERAGEREDEMTTLALDYNDIDRLGKWTAHLQLMNGPLDIVVAWIHGDPMAVVRRVVDEVDNYRQSPWDFYHICGSSRGKWDGLSFTPPSSVQYHRVILGHVKDARGRRWLTHEEICRGIATSIEDGANLSVVGTLDAGTDGP